MRITVTAAPGVFPAGAVLSVTRVTAAQQAQVDRAVDRVQDDQMQVVVSYAFDIKILDENGNELQPADGQTVNVSFSLAEVANTNLQTTVYHMEEQGNGTMSAERLSTQESGQTVTAQSNGFSTYVITFSTEKDRHFSVLADTTIAVSEVISAVGWTGSPTAVQLSPPEEGKGVSLTGERQNWTIKAESQSASGEQKLTVTLDGLVFPPILVSVSEQVQETNE